MCMLGFINRMSGSIQTLCYNTHIWTFSNSINYLNDLTAHKLDKNKINFDITKLWMMIFFQFKLRIPPFLPNQCQGQITRDCLCGGELCLLHTVAHRSLNLLGYYSIFSGHLCNTNSIFSLRILGTIYFPETPTGNFARSNETLLEGDYNIFDKTQ